MIALFLHLYFAPWKRLKQALAASDYPQAAKQIPHEIQEAARVDGCTHGQIFRKVFLPLMTPGLFATAVIVFLFSWNDFIVAVNLTAKATQTLPVSIATFSQQYEVRYGEMAAGSLVSLLPALVLSFFAQKYIVRGLTAGAVK